MPNLTTVVPLGTASDKLLVKFVCSLLKPSDWLVPEIAVKEFRLPPPAEPATINMVNCVLPQFETKSLPTLPSNLSVIDIVPKYPALAAAIWDLFSRISYSCIKYQVVFLFPSTLKDVPEKPLAAVIGVGALKIFVPLFHDLGAENQFAPPEVLTPDIPSKDHASAFSPSEGSNVPESAVNSTKLIANTTKTATITATAFKIPYSLFFLTSSTCTLSVIIYYSFSAYPSECGYCFDWCAARIALRRLRRIERSKRRRSCFINAILLILPCRPPRRRSRCLLSTPLP